MVRSGQAPVAIAGGTEACLTVGTLKAWEALRILSNDTCRPFSKNRSGLVLGEGAAILVLESRERAVARGAPIYAELRGFGMSADAADLISPDPDGAARAMRSALLDAQTNVDDIDYVNAHGTGTTLNDRTETKALRSVFGQHADKLAVSSNKGVLAHGLGCAGALEAAATALALHAQIVPPTANFQEKDPECDLDVVPNVARQASIRSAISNSFAFGGLNAVLVLGKA
jgi:nodulation protein E